MLRIPGWVAFLVFIPLQVWFAIMLFQSYGFWVALLTLFLVALVAARAARAPWIRALFFPEAAWRHEQRRHVYQGVLFLFAALAWLLAANPQAWMPTGVTAWLQRGLPWLPLAALVSLVKSTLR